MKIRSLKPEFFADARMAQLSPMARLLYMGLWCIVDDEGRGRYHPKAIEGEVFPHEQVDILSLLDELIDMRRIVTYKVSEQTYFYLPTFKEHQHPNRSVTSRLPAPPKQRGRTPKAARAQDNDTASTLHEQREPTAPTVPVLVEVLVEGEGEVQGEGGVEEGGGVEGETDAPAARHPNFVWDAFADLFGQPTNPKAEKRRGGNVNPVIQSLANAWHQSPKAVRENPAAYTAVRARTERWPLHFDTATLTEEALAKHWDTLGRPPARATPQQAKKLNSELAQRQRQAELEQLRPAT